MNEREQAALEQAVGFVPVSRADFDEILRVARVVRHKQLKLVMIERPGKPRATVYLVDEEPIAACVVKENGKELDYFKRLI